MTTQEFIFNLPLYTRVKLSEGQILDDFTSNRLRIDGYNPLRDIVWWIELILRLFQLKIQEHYISCANGIEIVCL